VDLTQPPPNKRLHLTARGLYCASCSAGGVGASREERGFEAAAGRCMVGARRAAGEPPAVRQLGWCRMLRRVSSIRYSVVLNRGLLLLWSGWFSTVFASNLADGLRQVGVLQTSWRFASGNFSLISEAIGIYSFSKPWASVLFGAVLLVQLAASLLFWRAFVDPQAAVTRGHPKVLQAFSVAVGLFAGFLLADEFFIVYERLPALETTHLLVFCALLLSLVVISVLDDDTQAA
jgi:hypothetical protein